MIANGAVRTSIRNERPDGARSRRARGSLSGQVPHEPRNVDRDLGEIGREAPARDIGDDLGPRIVGVPHLDQLGIGRVGLWSRGLRRIAIATHAKHRGPVIPTPPRGYWTMGCGGVPTAFDVDPNPSCP